LRFFAEKDPTLLLWRGALDATPAHLAASHGHLPALQLLADACPATLAARDMRGSTPLHYAALHGRLDVITWVRIDSTRSPPPHPTLVGAFDLICPFFLPFFSKDLDVVNL
jgi:hypothetical protein